MHIGWTHDNEELTLEWRESGGPIVSIADHRGFGMRLLSGALDQFGGKMQTSFEESGLICKMNVKLPDAMDKTISQLVTENVGLTSGAPVSRS